MLSRNDMVSLAQASSLHERIPHGHRRSDHGPVAVNDWRSRALIEPEAFGCYLDEHSLDAEDLGDLLSGVPWTPQRGALGWLADVHGWLLPPGSAARTYVPGDGGLVVEGTSWEDFPFRGCCSMSSARRASILTAGLGLAISRGQAFSTGWPGSSRHYRCAACSPSSPEIPPQVPMTG